MIDFQTTYTQLPEDFYQKTLPTPLSQPQLMVWNDALSKSLSIDIPAPQRADFFSGNIVFPNCEPIATAYAGHQFGHLNMLGDGRALLLGEIPSTNKTRVDLQLKGSGPTPYSRRGDGRGTLSSMLREYLISEAMFALGIPTSRSLAVVRSNEKIMRQYLDQSAVLTRSATSFIRVGTFEFAAYFLGEDALNKLLDYTLKRHYPTLLGTENLALSLIEKVMHQQIDLIIHWMRIGFIHGVMNTDNVAISGETIDYGPCAFMNIYHPDTVFSSIDEQGRYAFNNQAVIGQWNIGCLANALLPLIHSNEKIAVDMAEQILHQYPDIFQEKYQQMMAKKIGFTHSTTSTNRLFAQLLDIMHTHRLDYTNTFLSLTDENLNLISQNTTLEQWKTEWKKSLIDANQPISEAVKIMVKHNPSVIPRNHLVEEALTAAREKSDLSVFNQLHKILQNPYTTATIDRKYQTVVELNGYQTFCGT